jgi:serine/threonine protein kinase
LFVALERTEGRTLREILDSRGALDPCSALRVAGQVGEGLEALHHSGIVHGELCPESVLMVRDDHGAENVKLVGVELTAAHRTGIGLSLRDASLLPDLAPEQIEGETTEATDVHALGRLLRALLNAEPPRESVGTQHATPAVPPAIGRIIAKALGARPDQRYPDITVMLNDMWGAQSELEAPPARPRAVKVAPTTHQRRASRAPRFSLGLATVLAAGGLVVAAAVWVGASDRIASRFRAGVAASALTTAPVEPRATVPSVEAVAVKQPRVPLSPSANPESTSTTPSASGVIEDASAAKLPARPAVKAPPTPVGVPDQALAAPVARGPRRRAAPSEAPTERAIPTDQPRTDPGDGSAIIDWLLKQRSGG